MKTYSMRAKEVSRDWYVVDAHDMVLGRLAAEVATILRGKHKAKYTPHMDCGDHVVVINATCVHLTGTKRKSKVYHRHTGYPGGLKTRGADEILSGAHPERVVYKAIERMVPRGPLGRRQMRHLKVYAGDSHPHEAQKPQVLDLKSRNPKNARRS